MRYYIYFLFEFTLLIYFSKAIVIEGGRPLHGEVAIGGAKNAVLPMMAACLLVPGPIRIRNVPRLRDVVTFLALLREMGVAGGYEDHSLFLDASRDFRAEVEGAKIDVTGQAVFLNSFDGQASRSWAECQHSIGIRICRR